MTNPSDQDSQNSEETQELDVTGTQVIENVANDDTAEANQWINRRPKIIPKEIVQFDDGGRGVVFRTIKTARRGKHVWERKTFYRVEEKIMRLEETAFIEPHLVNLLDFEPVVGEDRIFLLNRRSWWEHGPRQLAILFGAMLWLALCVFLAVNSYVPGFYSVLAAIAGMIITVPLYFVVWMRWAYEYLVITNKRLGLIYHPPLGLVGTGPMAFLDRLTLNEANDQSWFANLIGNKNPAYRYGKLNLDTNAQEDEWMREIPFVRQHKDVRELIARLIADYHVIEVRETPEQLTSRELQDKANRAVIAHFGDPDA